MPLTYLNLFAHISSFMALIYSRMLLLCSCLTFVCFPMPLVCSRVVLFLRRMLLVCSFVSFCLFCHVSSMYMRSYPLDIFIKDQIKLIQYKSFYWDKERLSTKKFEVWNTAKLEIWPDQS